VQILTPTPDISCHGIDLSPRTQFHYGKRQKKRDPLVDPSLSCGIESLVGPLPAISIGPPM
jgi:hypothetical protein